MKKTITLFLVCIMTFAMTGCGMGETVNEELSSQKEENKETAATDVKGTWVAVSMEFGEGVESIDDGQLQEILSQTKISLEEDGKATITEGEQPKEGKWEIDGNKVTLTNGEGQTKEAELRDNQLILDNNGTKMIFEKK